MQWKSTKGRPPKAGQTHRDVSPRGHRRSPNRLAIQSTKPTRNSPERQRSYEWDGRMPASATVGDSVTLEIEAQTPFAGRNGSKPLNFVLLNLSNLHQGAEQPDLQRLVSMDWYHDSLASSLHRVDVVATVGSCQNPASPLDGTSEFSA